MQEKILDLLAGILATSIDKLGDINAEEIQALGFEHGKWLNDNVSDKLPSGQKFENVSEENIRRYLTGLSRGVNADEDTSIGYGGSE